MSAPKQQTAVQWLVEQIQLGKIEIIYSNEIHSIKCIPKIIEQAEAIEKEQICTAYLAGDCQNMLPHEYFKETYD